MITFNGNWIDDTGKVIKSTYKTGVKAITYPIEQVLNAVVRPTTSLTSSILKDAGDTVKKASGSLWAIAIAGTVGLAGYLLVTGKIKLPKMKG